MDIGAQSFAGLSALRPFAALERLHALAQALPTCHAPERLEALAGALPRRVGSLAPEVALALAEIALTLAPQGPRIPEDVDSLAPRLRAAWLRVSLSIEGGAAAIESIDEATLLHALCGWSLIDVADPAALMRRLARAEDPRVRLAVFEQLQPAIHHLAITTDEACECLLLLAEDPEPSVRRLAFAGLLESAPSRLGPLRVARERIVRAGLEDDDLEVAWTCMNLAANAGERDWLVELAFDDSCDGRRRAAAIEALAPLAREEDLAGVLELAVRDPLRFGPSVLHFVVAVHRHGVFVRDAHVPALLAAFDAHHEWTGELLVRVAHVARAPLLTVLAELPANDRRWVRRAAILAAHIDGGAALLIAKLLGSTSDRRIALALIDAAGRSAAYADEEALLARLSQLPEAVIPVLRVKGGDAAVQRLRTLVEDRTCPAALRPLALDALWALARDRATLLHQLCERLGPHAAGLLGSMRLFSRDSLAAEILSHPPWPDEPEHALDPFEALRLLCESGEIQLLPEVTRRFRELFGDYVRQAVAGDFTIKRLKMPALEQLIFRYGRHMISMGRSVRRWIEDGPDTGRELILAMAIEWLHEHPPEPVCVALLETIARQQPTGASLRRIEAFARHGNREIQRAALEAIVASGEAARGLELSIGRLVQGGDERILRQALSGVAALGAAWAEPMVVRALERPEMAIKREAAEALASVGSLRSVPALIDWLGRHDNGAFRTELLSALRACAGDGMLAILVDAIVDADENRTRALLREALSGQLTLRATLRQARSPDPRRQAIVEAAIAGDLRLADASPEILAAALHRATLGKLPERYDPTRRLRLEGFSPEAAQALLDDRKLGLEHEILELVRGSLVEWLRWSARNPSNAAAMALVLEAAMPEHAEHFEALLDLAELAATRIEPGIVASFCARCIVDARPVAQRARGLALVRILPLSAEVGGLRRWSLLARLGAVRDRGDLERCLAECRIGSNLASESERLLTDAFAIPPPRHDEARVLGPTRTQELEALRERAKTWYRASPREADAWLSTMLTTRPLDLPALRPPPRPEHERPKPTLVPSSLAALESLLATLHGDDAPARNAAAESILGWPDARSIQTSWTRVLDAYLADRIEVSPDAITELAGVIESWPSSPAARARAATLVPFMDLEQHRRFLATWIAAWERGEPGGETLLRSIDQELLIPHARTRATSGDFSLVRLLRRSDSLALRELIELVATREPSEVEHLLDDRQPEPLTTAIIDPVVNATKPEELVALIRQTRVEVGLAVRAIHALTNFPVQAADALETFTLDERPEVRSAALRALRKVASRERVLDASVLVLGMETRRDVIGSLLASLGHGRHEPGLRHLLHYLAEQPEPKLRERARDALLGWGVDVLPELRRRARKLRPDRRPIVEDLIAELEQDLDD